MPDNRKILSFDSPHIPTPTDPEQSESALGSADTLEALGSLVRAIESCGQNPVTQLTGYLITDDPTYLPECCHARALARRVGRDKLLELLIEEYLDHHPTADTHAPCL